MPLSLKEILDAKTVESVVTIIENLNETKSLKWVPVGHRENNLATINISSDPASGLIERITNAIDAVLERKWMEKGEPSNFRSPREAVETWFEVKDGRLANIDNPREEAIAKTSQLVEITLHDSDQASAPTVDIRDKGVGILAQEFGTSILGLNETRKLKKFFLSGAFGQGGSTALSFSPFTIIVSRKFDSVTGKPHPVAVTIVRFNEGDLVRDKHGVYEYMVDGATGHPFTFEAEAGEFDAGTLVRHVCMDLGKYSAIMTAPTRSLWYLTHHYLFDPVLPFRIVEQRTNSSHGQNRFVGGNYRRLELGENVQYKRTASRTFRTGSVILSWWVLDFSGKSDEGDASARNAITNYTLASKPIIITYNGQKQGELPHTIIKDDLGLPYLERFIVVHVDCDKLDNESRRQLFPTTRETLRDTSLLDQLRELVVDTLKGDDHLVVLDRQRRQRYFERVEDKSVEHLRKRLANRVKIFTKVASGGGSPSVKDSDSGPVPKPKPPIPVQEPPTFLKITTGSPKRVYPGQSFTLRFQTDAHPAYFVDPDAFIAVITPPVIGRYTGTTNVHEGYGTAYFKVAEDAGPGTTAEITLELRPKKAKSLSDAIDIEVHSIPTGADAGEGAETTPNINPIWVNSDHQFWKDNDLDESFVAKVERGEDSIEIYVSSENKRLAQWLARAQRRNIEAVNAIKEFYLEHICFHALLEDFASTKVPPEESEESSDVSPSWDQQELTRTCETICGIIEQMFDLITIGVGE